MLSARIPVHSLLSTSWAASEHGGLRIVRRLTWQLIIPNISVPVTNAKAAVEVHNTTSVHCIGYKQVSTPIPNSRGGEKVATS